MVSTKMVVDEPGEVPAEFLTATDEMNAPTEEQVAALAYSYWEARGFHGGSPWEDWFRAEEELKRRQEI